MEDYASGGMANSTNQEDPVNDSQYSGGGGGGHALSDMSGSAYLQQPSSVSSSTTQKASSTCGIGPSGSPPDTMSSPEENCISEDDNMDLGLGASLLSIFSINRLLRSTLKCALIGFGSLFTDCFYLVNNVLIGCVLFADLEAFFYNILFGV